MWTPNSKKITNISTVKTVPAAKKTVFFFKYSFFALPYNTKNNLHTNHLTEKRYMTFFAHLLNAGESSCFQAYYTKSLKSAYLDAHNTKTLHKVYMYKSYERLDIMSFVFLQYIFVTYLKYNYSIRYDSSKLKSVLFVVILFIPSFLIKLFA